MPRMTDGGCVKNTSIISRSALAGAVALAVLVGGAVIPAASATTAQSAPVATSVVAAKKAKTPKRVTGVKLAKGGSRNHNVRVGWTWQTGVKRYEVQVATDKAFTKDRVKTVRANTNSKPAGGRLEVTVEGLKNATTYRVRVRAVAKNGAKGAWSAPKKVKTKVHIPERVTSVVATPGPKPGEVRLTWKHKTTYTTHYRLELASTVFNDQKSNLPKKGRKHVRLTIPAKGKSYVIPASVTAKLGLHPASGNHLYYRFRALNKGTAGTKMRLYPSLHAVQPARQVGTTSGMVPLKVGSYNVVSARVGANSQPSKPWSKRKGKVASTIVASGASVVGLQEVSPSTEEVSADGKTRQTESLLAAVRSAARNAGSGADYAMVRVSPYLEPGSTWGSQGQRILYDKKRLTLLSDCPEYTGARFYSGSCTANLATNASDSNEDKRKFAYAKFRDNTSGGEFWFVSTHLDPRQGAESLRGRQARSIISTMNRLNTQGLPILVTGDLNSYQNKSAGNAPHDELVGAGFRDSFTATKKKNAEFSTLNDWYTTVKKYDQGFGVRLDYILGQGVGDFTNYVNDMARTDSARGSDHNMVHATAYLPVRS